ncbi:hypothetical protein [Pedobacter sp. Hv1]|uniref:hypothetical protein n=1 Tax=Pedobacter sp. Hv1 TaxID=1740090 RepID=UPI0006D8A6E4|nr:hypothetical protein [Pedobacter sp. Hv1]KQB98734.1 hypothetical protein AQF98_20540 [Pedobacter sp. Hv1]
MKLNPFFFFALIASALFFFSCNSDSKKSEKQVNKNDPEENPVNNLSFKDVDGIRFYEVKRRFKNGLSFNEVGFQQEPTWIIQFKAPDTMLAYSPEKQGMEAFYLQYDHGKVYNFAREFFRAIAINKDSLVLQRLQVDGKVISNDIRSDVYCIYYTKDYIENKLKTTVGELQRSSPADTAYIKKLSERTYRNPSNADTAFAARQPVVFTPKNAYITVEKQSTVDALNNRTRAYDYLYPEYRIVIKRSYKQFAYRFSVVVDSKGQMYVNRVEGVMKEDMPHRKKLLQGIVDVYLKNMLTISPGTTLGIPHSSEITLNVAGKLAP